jgi:hypothetical protein
MVLIERGPERSGVGRSSTEFVLVVVGVVQIIIMDVLFLSPNSPGSVCQASKQKRASHTTNDASNGSLGCTAKAGTTAFVSVACQ